MSKKEREMRQTLDSLEELMLSVDQPMTPDESLVQNRSFLQLQKSTQLQKSQFEMLEESHKQLRLDNAELEGRKESLEHKLAMMEIEFEELIDYTIEDEKRMSNGNDIKIIETLRVHYH